MQTISQTIDNLTRVAQVHSAIHFAASDLAQLEPMKIEHRLQSDEAKRKYGAIATAIEALKGAL
jgi:myo-inositol catabolism protein IolC